MCQKFLICGFALSVSLILGCKTERNSDAESSQGASGQSSDTLVAESPRPSTLVEDSSVSQAAPLPSDGMSGGPDRELMDDEINEYGLVVAVEDGPYPMFVVTVESPERQMTASFNLNIEAVNMNRDVLDSLEGKYATFYYISELQNGVEDMLVDCESIYGEYAPEFDETWRYVEGTLENAEFPSGDLPSTVSILGIDGQRVMLTLFVEEDHVAANGEYVEVYYSTRGMETITYLRVPTN